MFGLKIQTLLPVLNDTLYSLMYYSILIGGKDQKKFTCDKAAIQEALLPVQHKCDGCQPTRHEECNTKHQGQETVL